MNLRDQGGQTAIDDVSNPAGVDVAIAMDQAMALSDDLAPGNLGMSRLERRTDVIRRFADELQTPFQGPPRGEVGEVVGIRRTLDDDARFLRELKNVMQVANVPHVRLHTVPAWSSGSCGAGKD